mmetsp:Transcript_21004/g.54131  ORF Transcript_21004/g.54131 Transcript_21004/m.54131 type:complete len:144 (-) Transcript_21004:285-716(-)
MRSNHDPENDDAPESDSHTAHDILNGADACTRYLIKRERRCSEQEEALTRQPVAIEHASNLRTVCLDGGLDLTTKCRRCSDEAHDTTRSATADNKTAVLTMARGQRTSRMKAVRTTRMGRRRRRYTKRSLAAFGALLWTLVRA